jgi:hypothetical protein
MNKASTVGRLATGAVLVLSMALTAAPGFAAHRSSTHVHIWKDPAAKEYSHGGLPCSTVSITGRPASVTTKPLLQLDQIERQTMTAIGVTSERRNVRNAPRYRPAAFRSSERQPAINFTYHASHASGAGEGRSTARGR